MARPNSLITFHRIFQNLQSVNSQLEVPQPANLALPDPQTAPSQQPQSTNNFPSGEIIYMNESL